MTHHSFCRSLRLSLFITITFFITPAKALDSESDRERIFAAKSRKFYRSSRAAQSLLISGNKDSDYNSKSYQIDTRYYYQSDRQMHEVNFFQKTSYSNYGTTSGKNYLVKKSELYEGMISNKLILFDTKNYAAFYNRVDYDNLSTYYYDMRTAAGLGRIFFGDKIELDASIVYMDIKNSGSKSFLLPSFRANFPITKNVTLTQRGYWFIDYESMDSDVRTTLKYRLNNRISVSLNHIFEQRKYGDVTKRSEINQTRRYLAFGLVFDLQ